jgi:hypothetical protein
MIFLSLRAAILMVPSSMTMMHLTILNVGALATTNLHKSSRATRTMVLCLPLSLEVDALALCNRFGTLCAHNGKLLWGSLCARVFGCRDRSSSQIMSMVNHGHLAKSLEIWKICIHRRNRLVSKRTYFLQTLRLMQDLWLPTRPGPAIHCYHAMMQVPAQLAYRPIVTRATTLIACLTLRPVMMTWHFCVVKGELHFSSFCFPRQTNLTDL